MQSASKSSVPVVEGVVVVGGAVAAQQRAASPVVAASHSVALSTNCASGNARHRRGVVVVQVGHDDDGDV